MRKACSGGQHLITVTAAIIEKDGRILAARRRSGKHLAGLWEFPGGKLEPDETPQHCLARELAEEFGIAVRIGSFLGENVHDYGEKVVRLLAYRVRHIAGDFQLNDHDAMRWLTLNELHHVDWAPADIPLLAHAAAVLAGQTPPAGSGRP